MNPAQDLDVRSSFAVSYGLLEPQEQQVLDMVAAIPGQDFGLLVAKAITANEEVADCLDRLCDLQLLEGQENERYRFHDLVRLFGQENLIDADSRQAIGKLALSWYIVAADYADDCLISQLSEEKVSASQVSGETLSETKQRLLDNARDWFEIEWGNLKDLVKWAESEQQCFEASRLPQFLKNYASRRGHQAEMPRLLDIALNATRQNEDKRGEANTLQAIGDVQQFLKQSTAALENYQSAIEIYRQVGARLGEANTLKAIGDVQQFLKQSTAALENYQSAIEIYRQVGDRLGEANTLQELGALCTAANDHEQALIHYQLGAEINHQIGNIYGAAYTYSYIGRTLVQLDQIPAAIEAYQKSIDLFQDINMPDLCEMVESEMRSIS